MKTIFLIFALTASVSVYSFSHLPFPETLSCDEILPVFGADSNEKLSVIKLTDINSGHVLSRGTLFSEVGRIQSQRGNDQISFLFSDADQLEKITFKKGDLVALNQGKIQSVNGLHELNTRLTVVKCHK